LKYFCVRVNNPIPIEITSVQAPIKSSESLISQKVLMQTRVIAQIEIKDRKIETMFMSGTSWDYGLSGIFVN
jgi:hypothetical protein